MKEQFKILSLFLNEVENLIFSLLIATFWIALKVLLYGFAGISPKLGWELLSSFFSFSSIKLITEIISIFFVGFDGRDLDS